MGFEQERSASQPDPDFRRIDAVPLGALACRKKKQDRACSASAAVRGRLPPKLTIMAAFRMRLQFKGGTHLRCGERRVTEIRKQMCHVIGWRRRDLGIKRPILASRATLVPQLNRPGGDSMRNRRRRKLLAPQASTLISSQKLPRRQNACFKTAVGGGTNEKLYRFVRKRNKSRSRQHGSLTHTAKYTRKKP